MPLEREADDAKLLGQVIDYHQTLLQSPEALEYRQRRGISSEEAVRTFKNGAFTRRNCRSEFNCKIPSSREGRISRRPRLASLITGTAD